MRTRTTFVAALVLVGALAVAAVAAYAATGNGKRNVQTRLSGYLEVPSLSTPARGSFAARISGNSITYTLRYSGFASAVTQAHIHFGQPHDLGGVSAFLCGGDGKPACPAGAGTVSGTILPANVLGPAAQGIAAGEFAELVAAIRAGFTYVNVHSATFAGGEIRGQLRRGGGDDDD